MAAYFDGSSSITKVKATNSSRTYSNSAFVPELWANEVVAAYEKSLVMANQIMRMNYAGKKGDSVNFPAPVRGSANAKAASTAVTLNNPQASYKNILLNKHYEYSMLIEDIVDVQANDSLRMFYTADAGYALSKQKDTDCLRIGRTVQTGTDGGSATDAYAKGVIGGDGSTLYVAASNNETALTDSGFRKAMQTLDDQDVPADGRSFVIPPSCRNTMLGLSRFTEQAFTGDGSPIKTGKIGNIYGVEIFVSSNCDTTTGSNAARVAFLFHRDVGALVEQQSIRVQNQYQQQWLADLLTADTIYGVGELRDTAGIAIVVPA